MFGGVFVAVFSRRLDLTQDSPELSISRTNRMMSEIPSMLHGLGLAFVSAVAMAHGDRTAARNCGLNGSQNGGAQIVVELPLASSPQD
jgi:hypothetical protein